MTVVLADLRGRAAEAAGEQLRQLLPSNTVAAPVRLLVLDDTTALVDRYALFSHLLGSRRVESLICVAVGPADSRQSGVALRASAVLDNDDSATLWVGDEHGTLWGADRSPRVDPGIESDGNGLEQLVRCLSMNDIFDRVLAEVGQVPSRTASPGLRIATGRLAATDLRQARAAAVRMLIGRVPDRGTEQLPGVDESELAPLLGAGGGVPGVQPAVRPGGALDQLRQAADSAVQTAGRRIRGLGGLKGLLFGSGRKHAVWPWLTYTAECIDRYHAAVVNAFERGDTGGRIDARQGAELEQLGLSIAAPRGFDRAAVLKRLQPAVDAALGRYPLNTVVDWLRVLSERAAPAGSGDSRTRLESLRRAALGGRFVDPPPFPLALANPGVLSAVLICCLLAAVGTPFGLLSGVAAGVLWTLAAWFTSARIPTPSGNRGAGRGLRPPLLLHVAAAAGGVVAGRFLSGLADLPAGAGVAALCVAVVGLLVVLHLWWDAAASAWTAQLRMDGVTAAIAGYERLLSEVALREWVLADARTYLSDASRVVAGGLADTVGVLEAHVAPDTRRMSAGQSAGPGGSMATESEDALETLLANDLGDAVRHVLHICWERLHSGALGQARDGLAEEMRALLATYDGHLDRHHVFDPPPFADPARAGDRKLDVMLGPPGRLAALLAAEPGEAFVQLCATDDIGMLDAAPQAARMVRFAPQFVREPVTAAAGNGSTIGLGDVRWTTAGHLAGVLRLMPMRPGVVVREWASNGEPEELT